MLHAFIDESARRRSGETTCVYTLAAVIVADTALAEVRWKMEQLRYRKNAVVHWRAEQAQRRPVIAAAVAGLPIKSLLTVCLHDAEMKSERARRLCMVRLLTELSNRGVVSVTFESRHEQQDQFDRQVLTGLRSAGTVRTDMHVGWMPPTDPALWVADVVAGAVSWWLDGIDHYWRPLEPLVEMIEIDP